MTQADIRALAPDVPSATAARAVRLIEGFVVEGARDRDVTLWGHAAQQNYADLVSRTLDLARAEVLERVRAHLGRIVELLTSIDVETACGSGRPARLMERLFGDGVGRIDTPRELAAARVELEQLVRLTNAALDPLLRLRDALEDQARRIDAAGQEIEAAALSASFLSEHLASSAPALSRRFVERGMSLSEGALLIRNTSLLRGAQAEQPLTLIAAIQKVVLITLPDWLGSIAALTGGATVGRPPNATEAGELQRRLRAMLHDLKV